MAPIQLRRAIGLVKDKTSIGFAKAAGSADGSLEAIVVKATSHAAASPPGENHLEELVARTWLSRPRAYACVTSLSKRLVRTRDWVVALKALIVVHRLLAHGGKAIREEIEHAACGRFGGLLDLSGFRDEAHSDSWDYSEFVRSYAAYLGEKVRVLDDDDDKEMGSGFGGVKRLQGLLDRVLGCRPAPGEARSNRIVIAALSMVVADSFDVYGDLCEGLSDIVEGFPELGFESSAVAIEVYVRAARQIDGLFEFYGMCRDVVGVGSSVSYPEVHRISGDLVKSLEEFLKAKMSVSGEGEVSGLSPEGVKESVWMLPPPEIAGDLIELDERGDEMALTVFEESSASDLEAEGVVSGLSPEGVKESVWMLPPPEMAGDLIELDERGDEMALTVFEESSASDLEAEGGEDWELALVESASDLARQREELGGRFDSLVLSDAYDWAAVNQHAVSAQLGNHGTSSKLLLVPMPALALPGPEGMVRGVSEDPFAASLAVPPPSYVQMADMERKQRLLLQEKQLWRQYERGGGGGQSVMMNYSYMGKPEALCYYS